MFKYPTSPKSRCCTTLWGTVNYKHVSGCCHFSDINVSQGNVATRLWYGGTIYYTARNLPLSLSVKEFWKSSAVSKVRGKNRLARFFWTRCSTKSDFYYPHIVDYDVWQSFVIITQYGPTGCMWFERAYIKSVIHILDAAFRNSTSLKIKFYFLHHKHR